MDESEVLKVRLSKELLDQLKDSAIRNNMTMSDYVKFKLFNDSGSCISGYYHSAVDVIKELKVGQQFTIPQLFGPSWNEIPRSVKLALGRYFVSQVDKGILSHVQRRQKTSSNTQIYEKIK